MKAGILRSTTTSIGFWPMSGFVEVTAVPEASTLATGLAVVVAAVAQGFRRRRGSTSVS